MKKNGIILLLIIIALSSCDLIDAIVDRISKIMLVQMVFVEGGAFQMGNEESDNNPVHSVTLSDFEISTYEITQAQYIKFLNAVEVSSNGYYNGVEVVDTSNGFTAIAHDGNEYYFSENFLIESDDSPATQVSWYGAIQFCNWLSENNGLELVYTIDGIDITADFTQNGYRLPTEAEWEYAARGGNESLDYTFSGSNSAADVAWYGSNSDNKIHPVGEKIPNELGIYDMSGNVKEWCWDYFDTYYTDSTATNPVGPLTANYDYYVTLYGNQYHQTGTYSYHVMRGGNYYDYDDLKCKYFIRGKNSPSNQSSTNGLRIVRSMR